MAKRIAWVEQWVLDKIMSVEANKGMKWETDKCIYYAIDGYYDMLYRKEMINKMHVDPVDFTRDEAVSKCYGIPHPEAFIQSLEALGLIKFKEPEKEEGLPIGFKFPFGKMVEWNNCISALRDQGYQITKV